MSSWVPIFAYIVGVTEAAVLPVAGGLTIDPGGQGRGWDGKDTIGIQGGATTAEAIVAGAGVYAVRAEKFAYQEVQTALIVIGATIGLVQSLEYLNGIGALDSGDDFRQGSTTFSADINALLEGATPDPDQWDGDAAQEYIAGNNKLLKCVAEVAQADQRIADILDAQAFHVEQGRQGLAGARLTAIGALAMLGTLLALWEKYMMSEQFLLADSIAAVMDVLREVTAFTVGVTALGLILTLIAKGEENHKDIRSARRGYISLDLETTGAVGVTAAAPAPASAASDFTNLASTRSPLGELTRDPLPLDSQLAQPSQYLGLINQTKQQVPQLSTQVRYLATQTQQVPQTATATKPGSATVAKAAGNQTNAAALAGATAAEPDAALPDSVAALSAIPLLDSAVSARA